MNTKCRYWDDCYVREFEAVVTEIGQNYIILDGTYFYPQGGGQPGDTGIIGTLEIVDTRRREDEILHFFEGECSLKVNEVVSCQINWARRYNIMRTHSASHLVEYFLFQVLGKLESEGSFITEKKDKSTYITDINITAEVLKEVNDKVNAFIDADYEIILYARNDSPDVRYWECENIVYKCGGTHPHRTSEIGHVTVKRKSGGKGKQKIITEIV